MALTGLRAGFFESSRLAVSEQWSYRVGKLFKAALTSLLCIVECVNICDAFRDLLPFLQIKKHENTYEGILLLVKLHAEACNFTRSNTPPYFQYCLRKLQ